MRVCVSACLLGEPVRYDGGAKPAGEVMELASKTEACRVCPERAAGLPCPRPPAERVGERVLLATGEDVTGAFARGAEACAASVARSSFAHGSLPHTRWVINRHGAWIATTGSWW